MSQPGIVMMKEGGILTANFEGIYNERIKSEKSKGEDTSKERIKIDILKRYISNSAAFETRIDQKIVPNYWRFRFEPKGEFNSLLTFVMNDFVTEWITGAVPIQAIYGVGFKAEINFTEGYAGIRARTQSRVSVDSVYKLL